MSASSPKTRRRGSSSTCPSGPAPLTSRSIASPSARTTDITPNPKEDPYMPRIVVPTRDEAPTESQPILDSVGKQLGFIPNLHRLMALSPAALTGLVGLQGPLSKTLDLRTRDAISLAVSEANACDYCVVAHSYRAARYAHLSLEEIALNRQGRSGDLKREA